MSCRRQVVKIRLQQQQGMDMGKLLYKVSRPVTMLSTIPCLSRIAQLVMRSGSCLQRCVPKCDTGLSVRHAVR